tara:strand:- start:179 stop:526 length:348 start_codon:yes stop_codon:yes gene_type:complete
MPLLLQNIKKRPEFLKISKIGQKKYTKGFILQKLKRNDSMNKFLDKDCLRIGLTVTKNVGTAVVRNKIKRRLRNIFHEILTIMGKKNHDYVIIANKKAAIMNYKELKEDLIKAIN